MAKLRGGESFPIYFGAGPEGLKNAGELRHETTPAEKILWEQLRRRQLAGFKFRRQHPVGQFVLDFFCYESMLCVELDGAVHSDSHQKERDIERTRILNNTGIRVIRFSNAEVENDLPRVLERVKKALMEGETESNPLPHEGGRGSGG